MLGEATLGNSGLHVANAVAAQLRKRTQRKLLKQINRILTQSPSMPPVEETVPQNPALSVSVELKKPQLTLLLLVLNLLDGLKLVANASFNMKVQEIQMPRTLTLMVQLMWESSRSMISTGMHATMVMLLAL